jgi:hypothetical protein
LKFGKKINLTRITSAPLRRGVGGDVMIYVASTTSIIKVKPPLESTPRLLGGVAAGRGGFHPQLNLFIYTPLLHKKMPLLIKKQ